MRLPFRNVNQKETGKNRSNVKIKMRLTTGSKCHAPAAWSPRHSVAVRD